MGRRHDSVGLQNPGGREGKRRGTKLRIGPNRRTTTSDEGLVQITRDTETLVGGDLGIPVAHK